MHQRVLRGGDDVVKCQVSEVGPSWSGNQSKCIVITITFFPINDDSLAMFCTLALFCLYNLKLSLHDLHTVGCWGVFGLLIYVSTWVWSSFWRLKPTCDVFQVQMQVLSMHKTESCNINRYCTRWHSETHNTRPRWQGGILLQYCCDRTVTTFKY